MKANVRACTRCSLCSVGRGPIPFRGPANVDIAIVGEAPGEQEDKLGVPFVGPAGQLAQRWLHDSGFDQFRVAWLNAVSCYPNRTPTGAEVNACRIPLTLQLSLLQPRFVVAFGGVALGALLPKTTPLRIGEGRGLWFRVRRLGIHNTAWAMATWHPAAILRNQSLEGSALQDLLVVRLHAERNITPMPGQWCVKCKTEWAIGWVNDIGYCKQHKPKDAEWDND